MRRYDHIIRFILEKHKGQVDKAGIPYVIHPLTVAFYCKTEKEKIVALLHDILEDTDATIDDLNELGVLEDEIEAIKILTKPKKEDYMHYIKRVAKHPIAREVKIQDLHHNMDLTRLSEITEKDIKRREQYKKAYDYLISFEREI